ncbi:MAG: exo-alpha-sialidase [Pirellulaceae bacterium]|nr:exo-alpha-sialidase [Pirellulaceae bacterium]
MRLAWIVTFTLCVSNAPLLADDDITFERVIGPEFPGKYKHPATLAELQNGDLYIAYYSGAGEYEQDTRCYGMRLPKGSNQWTQPAVIADTPERSDGNVAVWQAPDGVVWMFYVVNYGPTWCHARVKYKVSRDNAHSWSDSDVLAFEQGSMARSRPILLNNGDYLLPLYHETGDDPEKTAADTCSYFLRYNVATKSWSETNRIYSKTGNMQASPVQIDDHYLVAYLRPGGDFEPDPNRFLYRSQSLDGGKTWTPGEPTEFKNPNSAADFIKLRNGHLLLVFNDTNIDDRMPLTVAISTDNDRSYPYRRNVVNKPGDTAAYPSAIQTQDGRIHIVYTSGNREQIDHISFDEQAILKYKR